MADMQGRVRRLHLHLLNLLKSDHHLVIITRSVVLKAEYALGQQETKSLNMI